jgi:hypothetical protein
MPRIQILELPVVHHGDDMETPFILIIDQASADNADNIRRSIDAGHMEQVGARAVLCFTETVDIPANGPITPEAVLG